MTDQITLADRQKIVESLPSDRWKNTVDIAISLELPVDLVNRHIRLMVQNGTAEMDPKEVARDRLSITRARRKLNVAEPA